MFRFTIRDVLQWIQRPIEAAAATIVGAFILYWLAPLGPNRRGIVTEVEALKFMLLGAILGAFSYLALRAFEFARST